MAKVVIRPTATKGLVLLGESKTTPVLNVNGQQISGQYVNSEKQPNGTTLYQYKFPGVSGGEVQNGTISYGGQTSPPLNFAGGQAEYRSESGGIQGVDQAPNKALRGMGGMGGGFGATQVGPYGFAPANLMGQFPNPVLSNYQPIQAAPYKFTDVKKFAKEFGAINRGEINKNYGLSKNIALDTLNTELSSLQSYVPAAAALKRNETSIDNRFNQSERTQQLDTALPGVRGQLASQGQRAETLANGRLPDAVQDRAYELGVRSGAADISAGGGFGASSSVSRKASDLMSAKERLGISQYGDQLLSNNITQRVNTELAPTEYSNAGSQVNVNPSVGFSQLSQNTFGQINNATILPTQSAITNQIQQNQFVTGNEQNTRQFNASNQLQNSQFNAGTQNSFALQKFGYATSLAGAFAGAAQTNSNTELGLQQQQQAQQVFSDHLGKAQDAQSTASLAQGLGTVVAGAAGLYNTFGGSKGTGVSSVGVQTTPTVSVDGGTQGGTGSDTPANLSVPDFSLDTGSGSSSSSGSGSASVTPATPSGLDTSTSGVTAPSDFTMDTTGYTLLDSGVDLRTAFSKPVTAKALADTSNTVLRTAGLSNEQSAHNEVPVGVNTRGQQVFANRALLNSANLDTGSKMINGVKELVSPFNVLTAEDTAKLDSISSTLQNASTIAALTDAAQRKDSKAFINTMLAATKQPAIDAVSKDIKDPTKKAQAQGGVASAYTAAQLYENWDTMSPAQKTLGMAALAIQGYKTASGVNLAAKPIVEPIIENGKITRPGMTVGEGLGLLNAGYNAYAVAKNWDQLNTVQKIAGVTGTASQLASLGKSMGMLGSGTTGAAVNITSEGLSKLGAIPSPSFGVGAVTVPSGTTIPQGYTTLGAPNEGGQVIIPEANANSGAAGYLGTAAGVAGASSGAYQVYKNWGAGGQKGAVNGAVGGSAMAAGLNQLGQSNPYLLGGIIAASTIGGAMGKGPASTALEIGTAGATVYGATTAAGSTSAGAGSFAAPLAVAGGVIKGAQVLGSDGTSAQKAKALRQTGEDTAAAVYTLGLSAVAQYADQKFFGGKGQKFRDKNEKYATLGGSVVSDKITAKVIGAVTGGKNEAQTGRDKVRELYKNSGLVNDKFETILADGSTADVGMDGHGGTHEFTNPDQSIDKKAKKLSSYDVDYTNDLDYAASMGGMTLSRLLAGGQAQNVDQVGGQLGNATLKNVGFNKDMSPENFNKMIENQRANYARVGIKSKDDALQLANQAYSEGRLDDTQHAVALQSVNMIFDNNGYDTARKLMDGRHTGIAAIKDLPDSSARPVGKDIKGIKDVPSNIKLVPDSGFSGPSGKSLQISGLPKNISRPGYTKEEVRQKNASRGFRKATDPLPLSGAA